jgi:hypothetical protein
VLLIEAGGSNADAAHQTGDERYAAAFADGTPMNWHYKTTPQTHLTGQEIDYSRGKGLGGSTAINFCGWTHGSRDDYDEWASIVGDKRFAWKNVNQVLKRISNLDPKIPDQRLKEVINAKLSDHSTKGNLNLTYGEEWLPDVGDIFTAAEQVGHKINHDVNNGDPIGMGMGSVCIAKGIRATSASAYLSRPPSNLRIVINAPVARVIFSGKRASGVQCIDGRRFVGRKEVVLSGGALNTPQILKLSGIGPAEELKRHGIALVHELPMVGENLQDHCFSTVGIVLKKDESLPAGPPHQSPTPMGWFKLPSVTSSPEFQQLPMRVQRHMHKPTVPAMEIATARPSYPFQQPLTNTTPALTLCLPRLRARTLRILLRRHLPNHEPAIQRHRHPRLTRPQLVASHQSQLPHPPLRPPPHHRRHPRDHAHPARPRLRAPHAQDARTGERFRRGYLAARKEQSKELVAHVVHGGDGEA